MAFIRKIQTNTVSARGAMNLRLGVVDIGLGLVVHHLDQHFHGGLEAAGHAGSGLAGSQPEDEQAQRPETLTAIESS
jgi:hypothetical protein